MRRLVYMLLSFLITGIVVFLERKSFGFLLDKFDCEKYFILIEILNAFFLVLLFIVYRFNIIFSLKFLSGVIRAFFPFNIFIPSFINSNCLLISSLLSLQASAFSTISFRNSIYDRLKNLESMEICLTLYTVIYEKLISLIRNLLISFLVRDLIIFTLNFIVHNRYYQERIKKNTVNVNCLKDLNDFAGLGYRVDIDLSVDKIIELISSDGSLITLKDLTRTFGEAKGIEIFDLCKSEDQENISREELSVFYTSTLTEQILIEKSINYNNFTVDCLKNVLNVLLFLVISTEIFRTISVTKFEYITLLKDPYTLLITIFSVNYASTDSLKSFLTCLYFIFFIRPYEIGDLITYNGKNYKVAEINLLTTLLFDGNCYTIIPNSKMIKETITNMRLNKVWKEEYSFTFNYLDFEAKNQEVIDKVYEIVKKKPTEFKKTPYFSNIQLLDDNKVEAKLIVRYNTEVSSLEKIRERKNKFIFNLNKILQSASLTPI